MEPDDIFDHDDVPSYRSPAEIDTHEMTRALGTLHLLGDDPYLRMQVFNVALIDRFIMELEHASLQKRRDEEPRSFTDTMFLSAQTQMWIFSVYELLRTWRQRAKEVIDLASKGSLAPKIKELESQLSELHAGRKPRVDQLREVLAEPARVIKIRDDLRLTYMPFRQIEFVRIVLAKHEIRGKEKSIAEAPGYARVDKWCGSLTYVLEKNGATFGEISRRNIAEALRGIADRANIPSDEDVASFDAYMKGPPAPAFAKGRHDGG